MPFAKRYKATEVSVSRLNERRSEQRKPIQREAILAVFDYDAENGLLFWKERSDDAFSDSRYARTWNTRLAGKRAGHIAKSGYAKVKINDSVFAVHRLIWTIETGEIADCIDHINGNRSDNRFINLRNVSKEENSKNAALSRRNTSGCSGVSFQSTLGLWEAYIWSNGKPVYLGRFSEKEKAIEARKQAEPLYGYHPNHGRVA
ncbi:HNH endonuclease protein [Rhizobium phage RHph_Y1_10]|nr:HNH endonuclease protein [Rhizobium phage RHph_Y1_10]